MLKLQKTVPILERKIPEYQSHINFSKSQKASWNLDDLQESYKAKYTVSAPFSLGLIEVKGIILINELVFDTNKLLIMLGHYVKIKKKYTILITKIMKIIRRK